MREDLELLAGVAGALLIVPWVIKVLIVYLKWVFG